MASAARRIIIEITPHARDDLIFFFEDLRRLREENGTGDVEAEKLLKAAYDQRKLEVDGDTVDFNDESLRNVYVFQYGLAHLLGTASCLNKIATYEEDTAYQYHVWLRYQTGNRLKVCAIGGGPGTDVFALQAHLLWLHNEMQQRSDFFPKGYRLPAVRQVTVLDKYSQGWGKVYECLRKSLYLPEASFIEFDFEKMVMDEYDGSGSRGGQSGWLRSVKEADFVTMVKFVSSVMRRGSADADQIRRFQDNLKKVLLLMKHYSLFLYVDVDDKFYGTKVSKTLRDAKFIKFFEGSFTFDISGYDFGGLQPVGQLPLNIQLWCCQNDIHELFPSFT